jgi:hypothetical protein
MRSTPFIGLRCTSPRAKTRNSPNNNSRRISVKFRSKISSRCPMVMKQTIATTGNMA